MFFPLDFRCTECNRSYANIFVLEQHKKQHEKEQSTTLITTENKVYLKFIADNFDMSCELCENKSFTTLSTAHRHYKAFHNLPHGYVRCCGKRLRSPKAITEHINRHFNPETFK